MKHKVAAAALQKDLKEYQTKVPESSEVKENQDFKQKVNNTPESSTLTKMNDGYE